MSRNARKGVVSRLLEGPDDGSYRDFMRCEMKTVIVTNGRGSTAVLETEAIFSNGYTALWLQVLSPDELKLDHERVIESGVFEFRATSREAAVAAVEAYAYAPDELILDLRTFSDGSWEAAKVVEDDDEERTLAKADEDMPF